MSHPRKLETLASRPLDPVAEQARRASDFIASARDRAAKQWPGARPDQLEKIASILARADAQKAMHEEWIACADAMREAARAIKTGEAA